MPASLATPDADDMEEGAALIPADDGATQLASLRDLHRLLEEEGGATGKGETVIVRSLLARAVYELRTLTFPADRVLQAGDQVRERREGRLHPS